MTRTFRFPLFFVLALCLPLGAAQAAGKPAAASKTPPAQADSQDINVQAMNRLAKAAMEQSLKVMYEKKKPIYPFALLQYKNGKVDSMTYRPIKGEDGKYKPQPSEKEWATELFVRLRQMAATQPNLDIALLTRMDTVKDKQGKDVLGLWTEVDHRSVRPWVVFMPLIKQKDGSLKQGDLIYYATDQPIFPHPKAPAAKKAAK